MAYSSSGASQFISARKCRLSGSNVLPAGIVARKSNLEMRPLWDSVLNNRISKYPLNLWAIAGVKKKEIVNIIVAKDVTAKPMSDDAPQKTYDVFVSFRGEDIRHGFLSHLSKVFPQKQINAFVDDKLKRGDDISPSLLEAIEGSFISLIIFSENYASSRWCLEELEKIIECKEKYGQIVIPIFYNVDPSNVRHQKKSYENAFAEHEKRFDLPKVQTWRHALNKSANLSGIKSFDFRNDAELLEEIINLVLMRLSKHPVNPKGLIGIGKPIAHLESLLRQESKSVRIIGIWGMGGIGKTTIAEEIFNQNHSKYEGCCFLEKVSEELGRHGVISLKEKLFSTLLAENVKIDTPNRLSNYIERRIGRMKVLIVLDNVNDTDQLEKLFGTLDWFRSDSRIIITTRDKQVLIANKVDDIYEVGVFSASEALELFSLNAFNQSYPKMEYYDISKRVVNYAKGIPLVLKVLGLLLCGKDKEVWESQLDKLKKMPNEKVHEVMRLSYDDLDRVEKKIFLDIACFFNRLNFKVDYLKNLLKDCESDNSVVVGLERLKDKALITISEDNIVSMHDIIQEMGQEIVRQESEDPGYRSHLWDPNDICDILKNDKGSEAIRSIRADLSAMRKLKLSPHVFAKMSKLQFLDFHGSYRDDGVILLPQGLQYLSTDLRYLHWMHYPLKSLPEKFSAKNLVILDLTCSRVEKLWDGVQNLVNLKKVKLESSKFLKELPDFSKATNLEELDISSCDELSSVHPSIFSLDKLEKLNLHHCFSLTQLSSLYLNLGYFQNLREFSLTSIENIIEFLKGSSAKALPSHFGCQSKLEILVLGFTNIESVPSWIKNLARLRHLDVRCCWNLETLPELPSSIESLYAETCETLKTVLIPSTAAEQFKENRRRVEFWNCLNLDERSLRNIELNAQINLLKFANYDNYGPYQVGYVYPGSNVPKWLDYKTTKDEIVIDLSMAQVSPLSGFVFSFIIDKVVGYIDGFELNFTIIDGEGDSEKDNVPIYLLRSRPLYPMASDHVYLIYDQLFSGYLASITKNQTRFKIKATARVEVDIFMAGRDVGLKGFGVSLINTSTYHNFIQQMELFDYINKWNGIVFSIILCISFLRLKMKNLI